MYNNNNIIIMHNYTSIFKLIFKLIFKNKEKTKYFIMKVKKLINSTVNHKNSKTNNFNCIIIYIVHFLIIKLIRHSKIVNLLWFILIFIVTFYFIFNFIVYSRYIFKLNFKLYLNYILIFVFVLHRYIIIIISYPSVPNFNVNMANFTYLIAFALSYCIYQYKIKKKRRAKKGKNLFFISINGAQ